MIQAGTASQTQTMPVVRIAQIDRLRLILPVPESIAARIHIGSPVEVRVESLQRVIQGKVARFTGQLSTSTRTMDTEVTSAILMGLYCLACTATRPSSWTHAPTRWPFLCRPIAPGNDSDGHGRDGATAGWRNVRSRWVWRLRMQSRFCRGPGERFGRHRKRRHGLKSGARVDPKLCAQPTCKGRVGGRILDPQPVPDCGPLPDAGGRRRYRDRANAGRSVSADQASRSLLLPLFSPACLPSRSKLISLAASNAFSRSRSNIDHIESRSLPGVSLIKIYFQPGTDADAAVTAYFQPGDGQLQAIAPGNTSACGPEVRCFQLAGLPDHG